MVWFLTSSARFQYVITCHQCRLLLIRAIACVKDPMASVAALQRYRALPWQCSKGRAGHSAVCDKHMLSKLDTVTYATCAQLETERES